MGEALNDWVKNKVGDLADKNPDTDSKWITTALENQQGIANAKDAFVIQNALAKLGFKPGKIDGIFRTNKQKADGTISDTMKAVTAFQTANNLNSKNGQVGPETIAALKNALKAPAAAPAAVAPAAVAPAAVAPAAVAPAAVAPAAVKPNQASVPVAAASVPVAPAAPTPVAAASVPVAPAAPTPIAAQVPAPAVAPAPAASTEQLKGNEAEFISNNSDKLKKAGMTLDATIQKADDGDNYRILNLDHSKFTFKLTTGKGTSDIPTNSPSVDIWDNRTLIVETKDTTTTLIIRDQRNGSINKITSTPIIVNQPTTTAVASAPPKPEAPTVNLNPETQFTDGRTLLSKEPYFANSNFTEIELNTLNIAKKNGLAINFSENSEGISICNIIDKSNNLIKSIKFTTYSNIRNKLMPALNEYNNTNTQKEASNGIQNQTTSKELNIAADIALKITESPLATNIRKLFKLQANTEIPKELAGITQETIDALKIRKIEITKYIPEGRRSNGIGYTIPYIEKGEVDNTEKKYDRSISFKLSTNLNVNDELMYLARIPETQLLNDGISFTNKTKPISGLKSGTIGLKDNMYATLNDGSISYMQNIRIADNLTIHDYKIDGSQIILYMYDNKTMDRSTHTLVVGADGSISENGKVIARKRTPKEQTTIDQEDAARIAKEAADKKDLEQYMITTLEDYRVKANAQLPKDRQINDVKFSNGGSVRGTSATPNAFDGNKTDITLVSGNRELHFGSIEIRGHLEPLASTESIANKTKNIGSMVNAMNLFGSKNISDVAYKEFTRLNIKFSIGKDQSGSDTIQLNDIDNNKQVTVIQANKKLEGSINGLKFDSETIKIDFNNGVFTITNKTEPPQKFQIGNISK